MVHTTVGRLACYALRSYSWHPIVFNGEGLRTDIGRTSRVVPLWLQTLLNEGDKGYKAPGCDGPPS